MDQTIGFEVYGDTVAQAIPTGWMAVNPLTRLNSVGFDTNSGWDATNHRYVVQVPGKYHFYGRVMPYTMSYGIGMAYIIKNGNMAIQGQNCQLSTGTTPDVFGTIDCAVGDQIQLGYCHNYGGNVNVQWAVCMLGGFCVGA